MKKETSIKQLNQHFSNTAMGIAHFNSDFMYAPLHGLRKNALSDSAQLN